MESKKSPVGAIILSLIVGSAFLFAGLFTIPAAGGGTRISMALMIVSGCLITVAAIFLYRFPKYHVVWGIIIFFSSPLSLISYAFHYPFPEFYMSMMGEVIATTFFMILGIVGGASGIAFESEGKSAF